ncbi:MAG: NADP-dependent oxidoreductase [Rhodobacterales bacterium]|nr:NADP-dependent oxidoreductase [Rhodobacterales bacterium]
MQVELITVPIPAVAEDEVLVSIEAFGVGIHDRYFIPEDARFPYVIGIEGAGRITEIGAQVADFRIGDRVVFTSSMHPKGGTWAEFAVVKQTGLLAIPDKLTSEVAATIPVAGVTALQGMKDLGLRAGESLFIAGASGAVGTMAIQLATQRGARVAGSASAANLQYMESLGAGKAVDYNNPDWPDEIGKWADGGVDAALAIQPDTETTAIKVVRDGGRVITVSGYGRPQTQGERGISVAQLAHQDATRQELEGLLASIAEGSIRSVIEAEYPFSDALQALEKTETRHARGKLVVKIEE